MEQIVSSLTAVIVPGAVRVAEVAVLYVSPDLIRAQIKFHTKNASVLKQQVIDDQGGCSFVFTTGSDTKRTDKTKIGVNTEVRIGGVGNSWFRAHCTPSGNYNYLVTFVLHEVNELLVPQIIWTSGKGPEV